VKTLRRRLTRLADTIAPSSWARSWRVCVSISADN